ncbi:MAG: acetamidase/formamidase family protein [Candidatus Obscuribacterales bacterium]|jgi:acetamidase/formamidase
MQKSMSFLRNTRFLAYSSAFLFASFLSSPGFAQSDGGISPKSTDGKVDSIAILQRTHSGPCMLPGGEYYVPASLSTMRWGLLPNKDSKPILTVPSKSVITFDTLSSEGMVEDQGRDPIKFFGKFGVKPNEVLDDAVEICASNTEHNMVTDGPHIIIGPVAVEGAQPGDVLKVDMISLVPRVPYGIVGNRHGKGALPGEFPQNDGPKPGASKEHPELYGNVFTFVPIKNVDGKMCGVVRSASGKEVRFPIQPFMGTMGVAPDTTNKVNSIPPSSYGGNLDLKDLVVDSSLYLPIELAGGMFFIGDPHFNQGDGEVALTALEASLRTKLRLTLLKAGDPAIPGKGPFKEPFAETPDYWIPIGLDPDLNVAMKKTVRASIKFLVDKMGMDAASAMAYLSAATDFEISQVVDETKGCHAHIRKKDF